VKKPAGPVKPTQPGLHIATKTTEAKAPTLVPRWGAKSTAAAPSSITSARLPRVPKPAVAVANAGLASERARAKMVERLIHQGIRNQRVLEAMRVVPRHAFVDEALSSRAYEDSALPIGHQQTISQPYVVARVIELALSLLSGAPRPLRALEVGGGCGYQAAVMSYCFDKVISVERLKALADLARVNLRPLKRSNLRFVFGDGLIAVSQEGPFDVIVCSAGMPAVPPELLSQLAIGGVFIAPIGEPEQYLVGIQRLDDQEFKSQQFDMVRYVPVLRGTE
jgi:protein-L-isoaspartate(D-aspartate) O-methyltransferase